MSTRTVSLGLAALGVAGLMASAANAAVVTNYTTSAYPTPFVVSSTDLINGSMPVFTVGDWNTSGTENKDRWTRDDAGGIPVLTNGISGVTGGNKSTYATVGANTGPTAGTVVVYDLAASSDIEEIALFFGWSNNSRNGALATTISYATAIYSTSPTYTTLASTVTIGDGNNSFNKVAVTSTSGTLASNVRSVRFDFTGGGFNGLSEIDVVAVVPEPASLGLLGLGGLALMRRRRQA